MVNKHRFPYEWYLKGGYPAAGIDNHQKKVFGTFVCGGGSTMGYKLAGYQHLGGVELDAKVAGVYRRNNHPKYLFNEDIRDFNKRKDIPEELYNLDLLDGSPPCSTFSMAGSREDAWGKEKRFAEGQKLQCLDELVFVYCDTIEKLKPKVCLLENVTGIITGNVVKYAKSIVNRLSSIGYRVQVFSLNAASMGVPQKRERVFFIGLRNDYDLPKLKLDFAEPPILIKDIIDWTNTQNDLTDFQYDLWKQRIPSDKCYGDIIMRKENRLSMFTNMIVHSNDVMPTITSTDTSRCFYDIPRHPTERELKLCSTFPLDYDCDKVGWYVGMSVPPVMTAQIAYQIYLQWLKFI